MTSISEIKHAANISDVWCALGGGKLRGNRGQAFWRGGKADNVALDFQKGVWFDHAANAGGDVIALVETVRGCDFREAVAWLSDFTGMDVAESRHSDNRAGNDWAADLTFATWWGRAAEMLADETLEQLPSTSSLRRGPTTLLRTIKLGGAALVGEYVEWRRRFPELTAAMAQAGRLHDARVQRRLALWIRRHCDDASQQA